MLTKADASLANPAKVRAWGIDNGWPVGTRGRLRAELFAAYDDAQHSHVRNAALNLEQAAPVFKETVGWTFGWEGGAYVVRHNGEEAFRSTLGYECCNWATERGIKLSVAVTSSSQPE